MSKIDMSAEERKEEQARISEEIAEAKAAAEAAEAKAKAAAEAVKAEAKTAVADPFVTLAKQYAKRYPNCSTFHITTDRQVFLAESKSLAIYHQQSIGGGEVRTIKVK